MNKLIQRSEVPWIIFAVITGFLFLFFSFGPILSWGGDIIEYFGIGTSFINHLGPGLTSKDVADLEALLNPAYLRDPQYYIPGLDGSRYPVHFIFYSLLTLPFRLILRLLSSAEVRALALTNIALLSATVFYCLRRIQEWKGKLVFLLLVYFSPIVWFIAWPGPEILYLSLIMLSVLFFRQKNYLYAAVFASIGSWHSQPLIILSCYYLLAYVLTNRKFITLELSVLALLVAFLPYLYNRLIFGVWTPWTIIQNIWTQYYGFGIQNIRLQKLGEQFFDFNMGLFWYMPVIALVGSFFLLKGAAKNRPLAGLIVVILVTALFYQTNPAWNYGTSGYGPTRHIIFVIPFLIWFALDAFSQSRRMLVLAGLVVVSQAYILSFNGFLTPNFLNIMSHNPVARFVLNRVPHLYNPTPELFVDRTNHTDLDYITTAIYKDNGKCRKAFVLPTDVELVRKECGYIPDGNELQLIQARATAETHKTLRTTQVTLYPLKDCSLTSSGCLMNTHEVKDLTDLPDSSRIKQIGTATWTVRWGPLFTIRIPKDYAIDYYSFEGMYLNY